MIKITRKGIDKAAAIVTKAVGAKKLARYAGETIARKKNPTIQRTVTGKQAVKSGLALAGNIASLAVGGAAAGVLKVASKARGAAKAVSIAKERAATAKFNNFVKRTYSGYEKNAFAQAAKRNAAKRLK
jgi:hypothetical protein